MSGGRDDDRALQRAVREWRRATPAAPTAMRARLRAALVERAPAPRPIPFPRRATRWLRDHRRLAVAATLVLAVALAVLARRDGGDIVSVHGRLVVADALAEVRAAERAHARAIARLEQAASPILARAGDPSTPAAEAARLLRYRGRLASLDAAIEQVHTHLQDNPGLASARTALLAAYMDKTELLTELIEREGAA